MLRAACCVLCPAGAAAAAGRQFMSIVEALNYLRDKSTKDSRDSEFVPGRMLVSVELVLLLLTCVCM